MNQTGKEPPALTQWEQLREKVVEAIGATMDLYGVTHSAGLLYGRMFFEDRPLTLEEMKDKMKMSKSNMSYAARALLDANMIEKLDTKQDRKDLYQAQGDFYTFFRSFFSTKLQREHDVMTASIAQVMPDLKELILHPDTPDDVRHEALKDLHKLYHAVEFYEWLQTFVDLLKEGELEKVIHDIQQRRRTDEDPVSD
ncbi:MarR family transcriptional regulator [Paenibacillus sp. P96]|uniref:HTH-type transcriptional regulator n=1 Tax=Paenibacillus zeirhizosphaerae TaxID=2987519 RepID=A0ABT9FM38_9BACL|nr:MarR family transcriptional regulator [Paenibacillus sp. P96]MDP4095806.1 MarR family transcriptional regulator [Paenibacillus sp. P96]